MYRALVTAALMGLCLAASAQTAIDLVSRDDSNARHAIEIIELGLQKAGVDYTLNVSEGTLTAARQQQDTLDGTMDIMWSATGQSIERELIPIRIPLFKGLLGHRVFITHEDYVDRFADVTRLGQLRENFVFGQGRGWPDTKILRHNGFFVEEGTYEGLFLMADGKRFHAFPRGIHEPWPELEARPELALTVEPRLTLVYRMPFYLFVTPTRPELAQQLERGLMEAVRDGSFDEKFRSNPIVQTALTTGGLAERRVFRLENPDLPEATPVDNPELWFDLSNSPDRSSEPTPDREPTPQEEAAP